MNVGDNITKCLDMMKNGLPVSIEPVRPVERTEFHAYVSGYLTPKALELKEAIYGTAESLRI